MEKERESCGKRKVMNKLSAQKTSVILVVKRSMVGVCLERKREKNLGGLRDRKVERLFKKEG